MPPTDAVPRRAAEAPTGVSPTYFIPDRLAGDAAIALASQLRRLPLEQYRKIVLSMRNVTTLDATGLAILVRLYSQLVASGRRLVLCDVSTDIHDQLSEVGLDTFLVERPTRHGFLRPITDRFRSLVRNAA